MADLSQVRDTIAQNLNTPIYPNGTSKPSITGSNVAIVSGWPVRTNLDLRLQANTPVVSVYPKNQERVVTKFQRIYAPNTATAATLTATAVGNKVTIGGTVSLPQAVMVIYNGNGYSYQVQLGDTLTTIATALALLIPNATSLGAVITVLSPYQLIGRISTDYTASEELARVDRVFMITIWAPDENTRFILGNAIDVYMKLNYRIPIPADNYFAQVFYHSTDDFDDLDKSLIYRRDLLYTVQYATTLTNDFTSISDPFVESLTFKEAS